MLGLLAFFGFAATIPAANWMIGNVGECIPGGPCLVPVGFGLSAPSGVLLVGAALVFRDVVHERLGGRSAVLAIAMGSALSAALAPPALAIASVLAFALAELVDLAVYAPLRRRRLALAVALSGVAGAAVDSGVFLWLAFGSLDFLAGNTLGKVWASLAAGATLLALRRWKAIRPRPESGPAT